MNNARKEDIAWVNTLKGGVHIAGGAVSHRITRL